MCKVKDCTSKAAVFVCLSVVLGLAMATVQAGCAKRVGTNVNVTPWEQVMVTNRLIAEVNNGIAKSVINANAAKLLPDATAKTVLTEQARVASNHIQLTKILNQGPTVAKADFQQISNLIGQIKTSADTMIASGNLGIKNPDSQTTIQASVDTIATLAQLLLQNLRAAGVGN